MQKLLMIFLGGGLGSALRWGIGLYFDRFSNGNFPWATFFVNIIGSFILGFLTYFFLKKINVSEELRVFATVGFCGGFTTFSTFALEHFNLLKSGEMLKGITYIIMTVIFSVLAIILGSLIAKWIN